MRAVIPNLEVVSSNLTGDATKLNKIKHLCDDKKVEMELERCKNLPFSGGVMAKLWQDRWQENDN